MTDWYYSPDGKETVGPIAEPEFLDAVADGDIRPETMVWCEGMEDWAPLDQVQTASSAAAEPAASPATEQAGEALAQCAVTGKTLPKSQMLAFGDLFVLPEHKDTFLQQFRKSGSLVTSPVPAAKQMRNPVIRTRVLQVFLWCYLVCHVIILGMGAIDYQRISQGQWPLLSEHETELTPLVIFFVLTGLIMIATYIATVISFCLWVHRMAWNARSLSSKPLRISPGWAVGWYFIPVVNLYKPYQSMVEIYKASQDPENWEYREYVATPGLVVGWWTFWILSNILSNVENQLWDEATAGTGMALLAVLSSVVTIISTVFALRLVGSLCALQRNHALVR